MSLTKNGSRIGMARHIEKREFSAFLDEQYWQTRAKRHEADLQAERDAMDDCIDIEGDKSFFTWYDDDNNVPDNGQSVARKKLIEERIARLTKETK